MDNEPDDNQNLPEEEEGGGPVKSFLEHLEDLRWTLVRSLSAILIGMGICLAAGNQIVAFLVWPLERAQRMVPRTNDATRVYLGTNVIGRINFTNTSADTLFSTNIPAGIEFVPIQVPTTQPGSNAWVLSVVPKPGPIEEDRSNLVTLKNYSPIGSFVVALQLALFGGLTVSAPFVIYFMGQFILPALHVHEKKFIFRAAGFGAFLFFLGVAFCYLILMQVALFATVEFSKWMGFGADEWRAEDYISFVCKFMLGMGLCFELPVILLALVKIGLLDHKKLSAFRSFAVVIELVVAAIVTPSGDPFSMILMALPIHVLYEVSVLIAWYWDYRDRKAERLNQAEGQD